ncbi:MULTISPECIES: capsular polysaccharide synthesis protein [Acinetobacter]|nr:MULTISPECIES: capsular polysaccharide synthesis protein [Acinetobacter]
MIFKFIKTFFIILQVLLKRQYNKIPVNFIEINKDLNVEKVELTVPKIIWMYWDTDNIPNIVKLCIKSVKTHCFDYEVNILNSSNINQYIDLPLLNEDVLPAQKADLIRLELLTNYGGVWMDASIFLTENLDWILSKLTSHDAFLFYSDECTLDIKNPISENWLIVAPLQSRFIKDWRDEFRKCITSKNPKKYYSNIMFNVEIVQNLSRPEYLLCYISAIVCLRSRKYNILYASSGSVGHYYNYNYNWNGYAIATCLLFKNYKFVFTPKLIKFTSDTRKPVDFFLKYRIFNSKSVLLKNFKDHDSGVY